jgi:hypothetical protein
MLDLLPILSKAKYLPNLALDMSYIVQPSFYYGPDRIEQLSDLRDKSVDITNPAFVRKERALGLAVEGYEQQLVDYYQEVLRKMQQYGKELPTCSQYFWIRPVLLSKDKPLLTFPWCDTYPEAATVLRALQDPLPVGTLLDDMDQGWEVTIYAQGDRIYLAEGDGEQEEPYVFCCTDRARLAKLAAATLARTQQQLSVFMRDTGQNPWQYTPDKTL